MEFRGEFTCKNFGTKFDWICQFEESLRDSLTTYDTVDYVNFVVLKERRTKVKNQYLLRDYCHCGRPVAFEYKTDTQEVLL